jgi:hypothetical protein
MTMIAIIMEPHIFMLAFMAQSQSPVQRGFDVRRNSHPKDEALGEKALKVTRAAAAAAVPAVLRPERRRRR